MRKPGTTGNDDFGARYYSNRLGRWLSSDWSAVPVAVPYANLTNPQTLNLYSMVSDDPESFADLDGHVTQAGQEGAASCVSNGANNCQQQETGNSFSQTLNETAQGAVTAWARDNGAAIEEQGNDVGRALGHIGATIQGLFEIVQGGTVALAGGAEAVVASPTVVGSVPGVVAVVAGTAEVVHGGAVLKNALQNTANEGTGSKSTTPTGKSSSGQDINAYGEKLGPSRRPVRHGTDFPTTKGAKDAARQAGKSGPVRDKGHFHATDRNGNKLRNAGHYNFPE